MTCIRQHSRKYTAGLAAGVLAILTAVAPLPASAQDATIDFGRQPWPGVTVKTAVATKVLEALGYDTAIQELGAAFVYQGLRTGDVDVTFGAWLPAHENMLKPLLKDGSAVKFAINLKGAIQGLAVPGYVCEKGVTRITELDEHGEMFGYKIYAIGAGAAMTEAFKAAVQANYLGLGNWSVVASSTAGMLAMVKRATSSHEPIVFHGWKPHWMAVRYDLCFLKAAPEDKLAKPLDQLAHMTSTVWTVVASGFADKHPEVAQFLKQFEVPTKVQSRWINAYSRGDLSASAVAMNWITSHPDTVKSWVQGVQTASGGSGVEAVKEAFGG